MMLVNLYYLWSSLFFFMSMGFLLFSLVVLYFNTSLMLEWVVLSFNSMNLTYVIYMDWVSLIFSFVVLFISSMVILYSKVYMGNYNYSSVRFLFLVLMFVFSMLLMILSPNLISIMLGWDGLGLISYCLVIYYSSMKSYLAGMVTCLINRLGDIGLLISISWLLSYGSWNFMFYLDYYDLYLFYLVIVSSFTKSAQIPFSIWLPAAMAAPTPVSALVHSSTLVTAGVYLLFRFFNQFVYMNEGFLLVSLMTMIMSSVCANYEFDLKSIIALSTLSQLGLMMSSLFMGLVDLSFFHLLSHAMFKSCLFLCSGIIIHLMGGCQDIRAMGSICFSMPLTCSCFNISNMALCGFPFLSGFYSKDLIIESSTSYINFLICILFFISLGLTSMYSIRLFFYSVLSNFNYLTFVNLSEHIDEMKYSIMFLSLFSLCFGCMYMWLLNLDMFFLLLPFSLKVMTVSMIVMGLILGYESIFMKKLLFSEYYYLNGSMWFMYSYSFNLYGISYLSSFKLNQSMFWGEYFGGSGLSFYFLKFSNMIQYYNMSTLKIFFISIIFWMIFLI